MSDTWEQEWLAQAGTNGRPNMIGSNTGIKLKVTTYNVAEYCMKTSTGKGTAIWSKPEKLTNLRKWIAGNDTDVLLSTEDATYLDAKETKKATLLLYNDRLPCQQGGWVRIRSKYPITKPKKPDGSALNVVAVNPPANASKPASGTLGARYFTFGWIQIDGKSVLVVTVHPRNSAIRYKTNPKTGPVADRLNFLQIVFDLAFCLKNPKVFDGISSYTKAWDYCVIGGDFNTSNRNGEDPNGKAYKAGTQDYDNLAKIRNHYAFDSASGGYLGWLPTYPGNGDALDNVLVSDNVILNLIDNQIGKAEILYSDHVPLVTTMTLLNKKTERFPDKTYEGKTVAKNLTELRSWLKEIMGGEINRPCK